MILKKTLLLLCISYFSLTTHFSFSQPGSPFLDQNSPTYSQDMALRLGMDVKLLFPSATPDRIILNLTADPLTSVAVNWRTDTTKSSSFVEVAEATHGPQFIANVRSIKATTEQLEVAVPDEPTVTAHYHAAVMDQLETGKKYVYRVGEGEQWSEWFQFDMPDPENQSLSLLYFGDAQTNVKSLWSRVIREAYKTMPKIDFMLHAGDLINRHNRDIEWGEWFHAGSYIHATVPSVMTPGNHEYKDVVLSPQWRPQFNLPANGPKGLEETCYQINYPNLKLISLDAEQIDESEHYREQQLQWLDSVLTNDPRKWTAITLHYPFYSTNPKRDNPELRKYFKPIVDKHKVDIVLQGHDHAYGRGMISNLSTGKNVVAGSSGTMYVVSVSGPKMYEVSDDPWMERRAGNTQLFQIISIEGDELHYQAFTATGELYDAFTLKKQEGKPNALINKIPDTPEKKE
ncbi:purple acid phosphatase family protein [Catalinimonas niigatensis]|uniref:purple acid phosphatase family protein n=1 Tax=Catalinimonas niigatensis TaxID=1397264 RepID=UPI0026668AE1|nr:metallophosphoesterase family protein [Catalinimonas niigatensis]WPP50447.1 metallophosphoesterase family protein [Catalinimonas niigatensis]